MTEAKRLAREICPCRTERLRSGRVFDDPESLAAYLEDALEDGDPGEFLEALGVVARARGMSELARDAGVARPALYRSLKSSGHPDFGTVLRVLKSLGVSLQVAPAAGPSSELKQITG